MRHALLVAISCLLFSQISCFRRQSAKPVNSSSSPQPADGTQQDGSEARIQLEKGKELYRHDEDTKAAEAFAQAVKLDPDLAEGHFRLALAYDAMGEEKEAQESYRKAIAVYKNYLEKNEDDAEGHYNLGQCYAGLHLFAEAVKEYRQATHLKSDDTEMYYDLGVALSKLAQYDEAVAAFNKSIDLDPDNYRAQDALEEAREGVSRIRAGRKRQEELARKLKEQEVPTPTAEPSTSQPSPKPATSRTP